MFSYVGFEDKICVGIDIKVTGRVEIRAEGVQVWG